MLTATPLLWQKEKRIGLIGHVFLLAQAKCIIGAKSKSESIYRLLLGWLGGLPAIPQRFGKSEIERGNK